MRCTDKNSTFGLFPASSKVAVTDDETLVGILVIRTSFMFFRNNMWQECSLNISLHSLLKETWILFSLKK